MVPLIRYRSGCDLNLKYSGKSEAYLYPDRLGPSIICSLYHSAIRTERLQIDYPERPSGHGLPLLFATCR